MEQELVDLSNRLLEEARSSVYPSEKSAIRDRYTDTSFLIFKTSQNGHRGSFLSFGSRRSSIVSNFGNTPTFIRRSFSSNGMLEYSVEQVGTSRWKESHPLPAVTKEEKECEDEEEEGITISSGGNAQDTKGSENKENAVSLNYPSNNKSKSALRSDVKDLHDDEELGSKNRKFFHHYDLPPTRKASPPTLENENLSSKQNNSLESQVSSSKAHVADTNSSLNCSSEVDIEYDRNPNSTRDSYLSDAIFHSTTNSAHVNISPEPGQKSRSAQIPIHCNSLDESEQLAEIRDVNLSQSTRSFSNSNGLEAPILERSFSVNEKSGSVFPRKSNNRLSLRELPHRSPTPPKKNPRKSAKNMKDKDYSKLGDDSSPSKCDNVVVSSISVVREPTNLILATSAGLGSANSLISLKGESVGKFGHETSIPTLPVIEGKPNYIKGLDDTPLFIVEDDDKKNSQIDIEHLASDNKVMKSFIVVHPENDRNSLGLAPLTSRSKKLSSGSLSSTSSSASSSKQRFFNGKKSFSQSIENYSKNKLKNRKLSDVTPSARSFFSDKRDSSQIKLLKFTKSVEETRTSSSSVTVSKRSNFLVTKGRIRSSPFEENLDNDSMQTFVENNSSRVCSVM